ncbi:MAG: SDR family oxidoreductase [Anaerolineae bacterium]|nr:SDR family oxidoreductase [Anaerolineae bacterium]
MTKFRGKKVLITGAASGIGRLMAQKIAAKQAHVVLWDINQAGLDTVAEELRTQGRVVSTYAVNLADREAIYAAAEQVKDEVGAIDVLINNAGIVSGQPLLDNPDERIMLTFNVNTLALFWMTKAFLPDMLAQNRGHIVTVASAGGIVGTARLTDYCASKFAAIGFDESLRLELERLHSKVRTTIVCPFYIDTGMFEGVKTRFGFLLPILKPDYVADRIIKTIESNGQRLIMPRFVYANYLVRILPVPVQDFLFGFFGINKSMDDFTGRSGAH